MWGDVAIAFLLAFITTFVITPYTIKLAKKLGAVDLPKDERRINKKPMPRLGGMAVIAGFAVSVVYLLVVLSIERSINLFGEENYYIKLMGFYLFCLVRPTLNLDDHRNPRGNSQRLFITELITAVRVAPCCQVK